MGRLTPVASMSSFAAGAALIVIGQRSFAVDDSSALGLLAWVLGVALMVGPCVHLFDPEAGPRSMPALAAPGHGWRSPQTLVLIGASVIASIAVCTREAHRGNASSWDVVGLWLLAIALLLAATMRTWRDAPRRALDTARRWSSAHRLDLMIAGGLTLVALGPMLFRLNGYPRTLSGDEASFALVSRDVLDGRVRSVFGNGYSGHPLVWNFVQAASMGIGGNGTAAIRLPAAIGGAACVPVMYVLALRLSGRRSTAVVAALLLATFHVHLFWSRSAFPNSWTSWFALVVLVLLLLALESGHPAMAVLTGLCLGWGQYLYFANRALLPTVLFVLLVSTFTTARSEASAWTGLRRSGQRLLWIAAGFAIAVLPQMAYYSTHPAEFESRSGTVSIFETGWLRHETAITGRSALSILGTQFTDAFMIPFRSTLGIHYRLPPPYVGWPLALPAAVGLGLVMARCLRPAMSGCAALFTFSAAGIALTVPSASSRWTTMMPLVCLFAALGIDVVGRSIVAWQPRSSWLVVTATVLVCTIAVGWSLHRYFRSPNQADVYSDPGTEIAELLAHELPRIDPNATVYFAGAPQMMYYTAYPNLLLRTPNVLSHDVPEPWSPAQEPPPIDTVTVFVVLPERSAELTTLRTWFPDAVQIDRSSAGQDYYSLLIVRPSAATD